MNKKMKLLLVGAVVAVGSLGIAAPANAVVCHDDPGSCCGGITIMGKESLAYNC